MTADFLKRVVLVSVALLVPALTYAQEATFTGAVTDSTGGVLPGVAITAVHEGSGNRFTAVTDDRGEFRLPVRVGTYRISAELSGFTTVNRNVQILVGQIAVVNVQMSPSAVEETVTVSGEARNSLVGKPIHKVDLRIQKRLPLAGRVSADGILEVFNVFNHANYGSYTTNESNANFGQPSFNANAQYFPRMLQLGFRATF